MVLITLVKRLFIFIFVSSIVHALNEEVINFNFDFNITSNKDSVDVPYKISAEPSDCIVDFGENNVTKSISIINWIQVSWVIYEEEGKEILWVQCEAETRGWLSVGFTTDSSTITGAEGILGWADRIKKTHNISRILFHNDRLLFNETEQGFQYWDEEVCQSREGRTILKFKRFFKDGKHPLKPYNDFKPYLILTIGDNNKWRSPIIQQTSISTTLWPGGPRSPEGFTARWIFHYIMVSLYILGWFVR